MLASSLLVVAAQLYLACHCSVSAFHVPTTLLSRRNPLRTSAVVMKVDLSPVKSAMVTIRSELGRTVSIILDASIQRKLVVIAHPLIVFLLYLIATSKFTKNSVKSVAQTLRNIIDTVKSRFSNSQKESVLAISLAKSAESSVLPAAHIASVETLTVSSPRNIQEDRKIKADKLTALIAQESAIMKSQQAVADAKAKASEVVEKAVESASFSEFSEKHGSEFIIQEAKAPTPTESNVTKKQDVAADVPQIQHTITADLIETMASKAAADQIVKDALVRADAEEAAATLEAQKVAAAAQLAADKSKAEEDATLARQKKVKEEEQALLLAKQKVKEQEQILALANQKKTQEEESFLALAVAKSKSEAETKKANADNSPARLAVKAEARRIAQQAQDEYKKLMVDGVDEGVVLEVQKVFQSSSVDKKKMGIEALAAMLKKEKDDDTKKSEDMKNMIMFGKLSPEMEANEGRIAAKATAQRIAKEAQEELAKMMREDGVEAVKVPVMKKTDVAAPAPKVDAEQAAKKVQMQREADRAKAAALEAERMAAASKKKAEKRKYDEDSAAAKQKIRDDAYIIAKLKILEQTAALEKLNWTPDLIIRSE